MEYINIKGFNCYNSSISNIAYNLGIDYYMAYGNLWSEIDFDYNEATGIYLSKRIIKNLEFLGMKIEIIDCENMDEKKEFLDSLEIGQWAIIEMDCYYLPWHNFYQKIWYSHHFPILKETNDTFSCIDPLYDMLGMKMSHDYIVEYASRFEKIEKIDINEDILIIKEDEKSILKLKNKYKQIYDEILKEQYNQNRFIDLSRYFTCIINNRYLYRYYLNFNKNYISDLDDIYFSKLEKLKNSFLRASNFLNKDQIIREIIKIIEDTIEMDENMGNLIILKNIKATEMLHQ